MNQHLGQHTVLKFACGQEKWANFITVDASFSVLCVLVFSSGFVESDLESCSVARIVTSSLDAFWQP